MSAWTVSLRALRHPLTLLSIGVLLLNDHVLKAAMPSVLTGKLSDFAGLFFFPFLLAAAFGLVGDRLRLPARGTAAWAFGVTLGWFALIKTLPAANTWTAAWAGRLLGAPVRIVLDPTDLLALAALLPAWGLWRRMERPAAPQGAQSPGRLAYLALGAASLAALATSPCMPPTRITNLLAYEGQIYARTTRDYGVYSGLAVSGDGLQWNDIRETEVPAGVLALLDQPVVYPVLICEAQNVQLCYRITGAEQVESSTDGGDTWQVAWQIPWGRKEYISRYLDSQWMSCKDQDRGPYDLILSPSSDGTTVVAAMGNEGVLTRTPDGEWHRIAISDAEPTPFSGAEYGFSQLLFLLLGELALLILGALLAGVIYTLWAARLMLLPAALPQGKSVGWAVVPVWLGILGLIGGFSLAWVMAFQTHNLLYRIGEELIWILLGAGILGFLAGPFITWNRVATLSRAPQQARQAQMIGIGLPLGLFPLAWLPFVAWVYAIIPLYALALGLSVLIVVGCLVAAGVGLRRAAREARALQAAAREAAASAGEAPEAIPTQASASITPRAEWIVFGTFWALAAWLAPLPGFIYSLLLAWSQFQNLSRLLAAPLMRLILGGALLCLLGWAGMKLARRAGLPAILSAGMRSPGRWLVLFLAGIPLGAVGGLIVKMNGGDLYVTMQSPIIIFGHPGAGAIGAEIVFRLFLLSALAVLLVPRLKSRLGERGSLWVCIALAALLFSLANAPWFRYNEAMGTLFLFKRVYYFGLGLLAGRQFTRDGLSGAVCISLGAELAWQLILPDLGHWF